MKTLNFGIEIETTGLSRAKLAEAIKSVVGGTIANQCREVHVTTDDGRVWKVVPDGSLSGTESGEIVSPILGYNDIETLQQVVRAVRAARATVDGTTGIHIHVGAERFDAKSVVNLIKLVHKQERLLEHALGVSEHRLQRWCQPIEASFISAIESRRPRTMNELRDAWYGGRSATQERYHSSRYHGVNLHSLHFRGTIEFRYFNGTLHAGEVKAYVQLVLAMCAKALASKAASSKRREFNPDTAKYDFRVLLLHLGMIGDEFKTARQHLTKNLGGSAAWKGQRRDQRRAATTGSSGEVREARAAA